MKKEHIMKIALPVAAVVASVGIGFAGISGAASTALTTSGASAQVAGMPDRDGRGPGIVGKVSAISGTALTVASVSRDSSATTTYTVDASSATVMKGAAGSAPTASSLSAIAVGDMVAIRGEVSGTSVSATDIMDGVMPHGGPGGRGGPGMGRGVDGTVTAVNGTTITITNDKGAVYTVNASGATFAKTITITASDIAVGDRIGVDGTVSGTTVTAKRVMDGIPARPADAPAQE